MSGGGGGANDLNPTNIHTYYIHSHIHTWVGGWVNEGVCVCVCGQTDRQRCSTTEFADCQLSNIVQRMYICMHVCMYVCIYVCMYV